MVVNILKTISYACVFIAGAYGIYKIENDKDKKSGLEAFVIGGLIPITVIGFIRHVFFSGSVIAGGRFFELECGGANLGIAIASALALYMKSGLQCLGYLILAFAVYLLMELVAYVKYIDGKIGMKIAFVCFIALLGYFAYKSLEPK